MFLMFLICSCLKCVRPRPVASVTNDIPRAQKWWLMYWVVFVGFSLTHDFISVGFGWLPLWFHVRLVCIVWLQLPYFRGAEFIFMTTLNKWTSIGREAQREQQQQRQQQQQQQGGQQAGTPTLPGSRRLRENVAVVAAAVVDPGTPSVPPLPEEDEEEEEARSGGVRRAKRRQRRPRGSGSGSHSGNSEGSGNSGHSEGSGVGMRRRAAAGNASRTRRSILGGGTSDGTSSTTSNDTSNEAKDE